MNVVLILAYNGKNYYGWQKNKELPTIEKELERALKILLSEKVVLQAASRTDRGVHSLHQVVNFFTEKKISLKNLIYRLNQILPSDIVIKNAYNASDNFHPSLDVKVKEYRYYIDTNCIQIPYQREYNFHYPYKLNLDRMKKEIQYILGTKDFTALTTVQPSNPICTIYQIELIKKEKRLAVHIKGDRFLYKMVRTLTGTLLDIGSGKISYSLKEILLSKKRKTAGITAPPHALFLYNIDY